MNQQNMKHSRRMPFFVFVFNGSALPDIYYGMESFKGVAKAAYWKRGQPTETMSRILYRKKKGKKKVDSPLTLLLLKQQRHTHNKNLKKRNNK